MVSNQESDRYTEKQKFDHPFDHSILSLNGLLHSCLRPSTISSSPVFCIFWLSSTGLGASLSSRRGFCRRLHDFPIRPVRSRYSKQLTVAKIRPPKDSWWRLRLTEQHRHQKCERGAQCRGCSY